jgi:hypothetical protein
MNTAKARQSNTALIIPDGRTRIYQKYPELKGIKIPAKDMFIGKMSTLCRQYAMNFYPENWFILTTNDNEGQPQLVRYDEKIDALYDNPPYPIPGVVYENGPKKDQPKYWKPFTDQRKQLLNDIEKLEIVENYSRIHFLGNWTQNKSWKQQSWDDWVKKQWDSLSTDEKKSRDLEIYKVYKSAEFEYSLYVDVIEKFLGETGEKIWLEYPLQDYKTKPEMISRITDGIYREFPLRRNSYSLKNVSIQNLFRMNNPAFTYEKIPLTNKKGIQIVTAPNGFGKSTIFRLLRAVLRGNLKDISEIPFDNFVLDISDRKKIYSLIISKTYSADSDKVKIKISSGLKDDNPLEFTSDELKNPNDPGWTDWKSEEGQKLSKKIPPSTIRFLSSDRLWYDPLNIVYPHDLLTDWDDVFSKPEKTRIEQYAKSLSRRIEGSLNDYASTSHEIDTIFPLFDMKKEDRIIQLRKKGYRGYESLKEQFTKLDAKRENLEKIDFLPYRRWYRKKHEDKSEEVDPFQFPEKHDLKKINTLDYQDLLDFYLQRQMEKYSVFEWLRSRCELFTTLVNHLFIYSKVRIQRDTGLSFYHAFTSGSDRSVKEYHPLSSDQLSSGEKHQTVLLYDFIFNCDPGTLVFIDEPEISHHIVWQDQFITHLQKIHEKNPIDFLIATHSTDIIGNNWDITIDLLGGSYS